MTTAYTIPLQDGPQSFSVQLSGVQYQLLVWWADADQGGWVLDILAADGTAILTGLAMVPGADLLEQFGHLGIGGALYVVAGDAPAYSGLGTATQIFFVTPV